LDFPARVASGSSSIIRCRLIDPVFWIPAFDEMADFELKYSANVPSEKVSIHARRRATTTHGRGGASPVHAHPLEGRGFKPESVS
jgi:hypothetical protein